MSSLDYATDPKRPSRGMQQQALPLTFERARFDHEDEYEALSEVETTEFAARLLDSDSEADSTTCWVRS